MHVPQNKEKSNDQTVLQFQYIVPFHQKHNAKRGIPEVDINSTAFEKVAGSKEIITAVYSKGVRKFRTARLSTS